MKKFDNVLSFDEVMCAVNWLLDNTPYKLYQWTVDMFGGTETFMAHLLRRQMYEKFAREIMEYGWSIELELVELMYN